MENNEKLVFLDVEVTKNSDGFSTDLFRKKTNTGLGMRYDSAIMTTYKTNLVKCLVDRAFKICSSYTNFCNEIVKLKRFFFQNGFPSLLVDRLISDKIESLRKHTASECTVQRKIIYCSIPFCSREVNRNISKEIRELVVRFYPQIDLRLIFKNSFKVANMFIFKDRTDDLLQSNVVYKYTCRQCNASYYGETTRHLKTRIAEHLGLSARTGQPVLNPSHSSIRDHSMETNHDINRDDFKIIFKTNHPDLKLAESILINRYNPSLNNSLSSVPLNIVN